MSGHDLATFHPELVGNGTQHASRESLPLPLRWVARRSFEHHEQLVVQSDVAAEFRATKNPPCGSRRCGEKHLHASQLKIVRICMLSAKDDQFADGLPNLFAVLQLLAASFRPGFSAPNQGKLSYHVFVCGRCPEMM